MADCRSQRDSRRYRALGQEASREHRTGDLLGEDKEAISQERPFDLSLDQNKTPGPGGSVANDDLDERLMMMNSV